MAAKKTKSKPKPKAKTKSGSSRPVVPPENIYPLRPVPKYFFGTMLAAGLVVLAASASIKIDDPHFPKYVFLVLMAFGLVPVWLAFSNEQLRIEVGKQWIEIHGDLFYKKVLADDMLIDRAGIVDRSGVRNLGLGLPRYGIRLPGYVTGWYNRPEGGLSVVMITDAKAILRVPTRHGWDILLSLTKNEELLARLQKYASRPAPAAEGSESA